MEFVYELVHPRTGIPGYVGITNRPEVRKRVHLLGKYGNDQLNGWVQSILAEGLEPIMNYLATTDNRREAREQERYWIGYYLNRGTRLMNVDFVPGKGRPLAEIAAEYRQRRKHEREKFRAAKRFQSCDK